MATATTTTSSPKQGAQLFAELPSSSSLNTMAPAMSKLSMAMAMKPKEWEQQRLAQQLRLFEQQLKDAKQYFTPDFALYCVMNVDKRHHSTSLATIEKLEQLVDKIEQEGKGVELCSVALMLPSAQAVCDYITAGTFGRYTLDQVKTCSAETFAMLFCRAFSSSSTTSPCSQSQIHYTNEAQVEQQKSVVHQQFLRYKKLRGNSL